MKRSNPLFLAISILTLASALTLSACSDERSAPPAAPETVIGIAVTTAREATIPDWIEAVGTVQAEQTAQVASQMMGTIAQISAREGDRVHQGQVLALIDDSQPRAAMEQAAAAVTAAKNQVLAANSQFVLAGATLKRYQQLYDTKSVSPQEFDEVHARYQSAEANRDMAQAGQAQADAALAQARTSLGYTRIRAPFDGVVTEKKADVGTLAAPGMPVFTIEDTRHYRLEATVDESDIRLAHLGQAVPVILDALGNSALSGRVAQIVPAADPASRSFVVKIDLPADARVRSGLFGRARFSRGQRSALLIPQAAAVERGQLRGVYAIDSSGLAGLRYVTLGGRIGGDIEVLSGLQAGEKLVADPGQRELGGKRIQAQ